MDPAFHWRILCCCQTFSAQARSSAQTKIFIQEHVWRYIEIYRWSTSFVRWNILTEKKQKMTHSATKFSCDPVYSRPNSICHHALFCKIFVIIAWWRKHAVVGASHRHDHLRTCLRTPRVYIIFIAITITNLSWLLLNSWTVF